MISQLSDVSCCLPLLSERNSFVPSETQAIICLTVWRKGNVITSLTRIALSTYINVSQIFNICQHFGNLSHVEHRQKRTSCVSCNTTTISVLSLLPGTTLQFRVWIAKYSNNRPLTNCNLLPLFVILMSSAF